jgi:hypothetical protein
LRFSKDDEPRERVDVIEKNYVIEQSHIHHTTIMDSILNIPVMDHVPDFPTSNISTESKQDEKNTRKKTMGKPSKVSTRANKSTVASIQKKLP